MTCAVFIPALYLGTMNELNSLPHVRLASHIVRKKSKKTVCVTACLTALGIDVDAFQSTSTRKNTFAYEGVIRRHGFALRSRKSLMPKRPTVGNCREAIRKLDDPAGTLYVAVLRYGTVAHLVLIGADGKTLVDTAPRSVDKRRVVKISAVWKK